MVIYVDVLIILNLYINFFLIRSSAVLLRRNISRKRTVLAALIGAFGSLIILAPPLAFYITIPYKIILGASIVFAAYGRQKLKDFGICALFFLLISFLFGGIITALWNFFAPVGMVLNNGVCFFNIPIAALVAFTAGIYFLLKFVKTLTDKKKRKLCEVSIVINDKTVSLQGLCDTGCEIRDIFSGKPVIICCYEKISGFLPEDITEYLAGNLDVVEKIRLIPCRTVGSRTVIPVFKAKSITVDGKSADALVGVSKTRLGEDFDCIFNPKIIPI